jgi:hypothetical protein
MPELYLADALKIFETAILVAQTSNHNPGFSHGGGIR